MPRDTLDRKIHHLRDGIILLDSMVESALTDSVKALVKRDVKSARLIYSGDDAINAKRFSLENDTISTIATQQPIMAGDLRLLASILEVAGELERMGDYAKGIARICLLMDDAVLDTSFFDIPRMAEITRSMLHRAVIAFISFDIAQAKIIPLEDDQVDELYNQVYRALVKAMISNPAMIDSANYLMWAAHNLERLADRVTNICERTIYAATGIMEEFPIADDKQANIR